MAAPGTPHPAPWSVLAYRVSSRDTQQRILMAFRDIDRPGVVALGTYADDHPHVVVESHSRSGESYSKRVIYAIDPDASRLPATAEQDANRESDGR
jgi:hypothetical protein